MPEKRRGSVTGIPDIRVRCVSGQSEVLDLYHEELQLSGYIDGVTIVSIAGAAKGVKLTENLEITPSGIEYMQNNSTIEKAKKFLKTMKEICPGL